MRALLVALAVAALAGCATPPPASDPDAVADYNETNDPLEPTNRVFYKVNDALDTYALKPAAQAYVYVLPEPVRGGIHNVVSNLSEPVTLVNDVLEAKPRRAGDTLMRLLINTTVGVVGIFDVASGWGYPRHDGGFANTLALWGLPGGPFLFLPVLGPSNPRDAVGFGGDNVTDPFFWATFNYSKTFGWVRLGASTLDVRSRHITDIDQIKKTALDPYATFRSLYRQNRESEIAKAQADDRRTVPAWFPRP